MMRMFLAGFACLLLAVPGAAFAQSRQQVAFASETLVDPNVQVRGELSLPASVEGKVPAVLVLHNAGGLEDRTGKKYVAALNAAGIATLELDMFPANGRPRSTKASLPHAFGGLRFLSKDPRIDPARIGVMGFSWGGILTLLTASSQLSKEYLGDGPRFAGHLALYPVCYVHLLVTSGRNPVYPASVYSELTGAPVRILGGEKDDYDEPDSCAKFQQSLPESARKNVEVTMYPGVGHGWDTEQSRRYNDAVSHLGRGGSVSHQADAATAAKSVGYATDFFRSTLASAAK